jgi:hypothetical protein
MYDIPRDIGDLRLAPIVLQLDDRLSELGCLDVEELTFRVALDSDLPDWDEERRREAILLTMSRDIDLGGWELSWDDRGVRLAHGIHQVVLGVPESVTDYVRGAAVAHR